MGKSPKSQLHQHPRPSSKALKTTKPAKPSFENHLSSRRKQLTSVSPTLNNVMEEEEHNDEKGVRLPLSEVVSDCVKRWFSDTLKEAKAGDINMQVLVAQMYYNGYGVSKDAQKVILSSVFLFFSPSSSFPRNSDS
jgi:TPR repeat protein